MLNLKEKGLKLEKSDILFLYTRIYNILSIAYIWFHKESISKCYYFIL